MKALIIVTVLAMATSAIAVPLSRQAKAQPLLAVIQDNVEMEGWLGDAVVKYGPTVLKTGLAALGSALLWDEKLDREVASVQKKAEIDKAEIDEAEMEGLLSDIGGAVGKYGPTVLKFLGGAGLWDEELERESAAVQGRGKFRKIALDFLIECGQRIYKHKKDEERCNRLRQQTENLRKKYSFDDTPKWLDDITNSKNNEYIV